ncbi:hypothetical protein [uncultured Muribaculum sp.]|uniref:hypothetical protein n=1 Tax=uncultured Muribaculum sp. TaxID=1918613 RepID=UPI0026F1602C|nr:hypothetical protein [uncultured Muribaculum sp.]
MTLSWIAIGTVELCVLGFIAAAAVIALIMKPGSRNEAVTEFAAGLLSHEGVLAGSFGIELTCRDDYSTVITRQGFGGLLSSDGSVSLAITIISGHGTSDDTPDTATFTLTCLKPRLHYHLRYTSEALSRSVTMSFTVTPGLSIVKELVQ